jgi:fructokinase
MTNPFKIGIDVGGTKIAAILLDRHGHVKREKRILSPRNSYEKTIEAIQSLVTEMEYELEYKPHVGIGIPGSISPATGRVQNANSTWLNNQPLLEDISKALDRDIRIENDANCFTLSEALDGAGSGARMVFGVIIGTGCGSGLVFDQKLISGPHAIGGEWGHNPLPWLTAEEFGVVECWCGKNDCIEGWISGTAVSADHFRLNHETLDVIEIVKCAKDGNPAAIDTLNRFLSRLARSLAAMTNTLDPDAIILGGGLSNIEMIYDRLPALMKPFIFADHFKPRILKPAFGDASGVRGAAHLWP